MQDTYILLLCIFLLTSKQKHNKKTTMMCDDSVTSTKKERKEQVFSYPVMKTLLDWKVEDTYDVLKHNMDCGPRNLALAGILKHPELQNLFKKSHNKGVTQEELKKHGGNSWLRFYKYQPVQHGLSWTNQNLYDFILEFLRKTTPLNHCIIARLEDIGADMGHVMSICRILNSSGKEELKIVDSQIAQFYAEEKYILGKIFSKSPDKISLTGQLAKDYITNSNGPQHWKQDKFSVLESNFEKQKIYKDFSVDIIPPPSTKINKEPEKTKPIDSMPVVMENCPYCNKKCKGVKGLKIHLASCKSKPTLS